MNGKYEIDENTFKAMSGDDQAWIMFTTFNEYRVTMETRVKKLEKAKWWNTAASAVGGVFGGIIAVIGKWFFFK